MSVRVAIVGGHDHGPIAALAASLPANAGFAYLLSCAEPEALVAALRQQAAMPVIESAEGGIPLAGDHLFVLDRGADAAIVDGHLVVQPGLELAAPLDRLLRSVSDDIGRESAGVILAGPGEDGATGMRRLKEIGGITIVQANTDSTSTRAALATGMIDLVLPLDQIGGRLATIAKGVLTAEPLVSDDARSEQAIGETLRDILALVRVRTGHDFNSYKRATLFRRVARRMLVCETPTLTDYREYLREHTSELSHLLRDFLISVTNFFRDPDAFESLRKTVIAPLVARKTSQDTIRVWIAGCATGEEAYSIGILLLEQITSGTRERPQLQIFATDIDDAALQSARVGIYPETIALDLSEARLDRFFTKEDAHYRVRKELRELVLFAPHNLLRDPPFSRLDLVACRNVMIYFNRDAQERALSTFHFALRPEGFLFLGTSEGVENAVMFTTLDAKHRLFARRGTTPTLGTDVVMRSERWPLPALPPPPATLERPLSPGELHHRLVERYAQPSVLIDSELEILHISERAGRFLQVSGGEPSLNLLRTVHPALRADVRTAIYAARVSPVGLDSRVVQFEERGEQRAIEVRVRIASDADSDQPSMLVQFDELGAQPRYAERTDGSAVTSLEPVVRELEDELKRTRDQLRGTIEQYETSVEELKASNEELQAINEELRSATEELETSKEELQSVNEELTTLNHELKVKVDEVSRTNGDLQNLMSSTDIGVLFLDRQLNLKRFTPRAQTLFNVIPTDLGRPIAHVTNRLVSESLPDLAKSVIDSLRTVERELSSTDGRRYLVRLLPYRSVEDRIDGVVLTFVDVTELRTAIEARRQSEAALETNEARLRGALRDTPLVVLSIDAEARVRWGFVRGRELDSGAVSVRDLLSPSSRPKFDVIEAAVRSTGREHRAELELNVDDDTRTYDFRIELTGDLISIVGFDVTTSKLAEMTLRDADRRKDEFLATLSHELRNPLTPLKVALDVARLSKDPAQIEQSRAIMERQVAQLSQLVDELLDVSRITHGKLHLDRVPLDPTVLVERALEATRPLFQAHRHEIKVTLPDVACTVLGDQSRLIQVFTNLLANAAKFTPDGGAIELAVSADLSRDRLVARVADNGVGVPRDLLPRIFEIFVQSRDDLGRAQGGLGIGLNLVKRLVELHGGDVSARSAGAGCGTEFLVELPLVANR